MGVPQPAGTTGDGSPLTDAASIPNRRPVRARLLEGLTRVKERRCAEPAGPGTHHDDVEIRV